MSSDSAPGFNVCGVTRLLVPAFFVACAISSFTGSDAWGWAAAALTTIVVAVAQRVRGTATRCAIDPSASPTQR